MKEKIISYIIEKQKEYRTGTSGYNVLRHLETVIPNMIDEYASQQEKKCNCPFIGHTAECDNCDLNKTKVIMKKDKSNICFNWGCTVHNEDDNTCKYNNKGCESRKSKKIIIKSVK